MVSMEGFTYFKRQFCSGMGICMTSQASRCQGHISRCAQLTYEHVSFFLTVQPTNSDLYLRAKLNSFPLRHQKQ